MRKDEISNKLLEKETFSVNEYILSPKFQNLDPLDSTRIFFMLGLPFLGGCQPIVMTTFIGLMGGGRNPQNRIPQTKIEVLKGILSLWKNF